MTPTAAPTPVELIATACFALAIVHTFAAPTIMGFSHRFREGSTKARTFHLLGEVEAVFGIWAAALLLILAAMHGSPESIRYLESLHFTEPAFVFVIMAIASSRPIIYLADRVIQLTARLLPIGESTAFYLVALIAGPLLGSFITEPAAMTVTALLLKQRYFDHGISMRLKYATIGTLFVNISIGGTLTHFAAPPVVMVASKWGWDTAFMLTHFGWKSALAVGISALVTTFTFRRELRRVRLPSRAESEALTRAAPKALILVHVAFLAAVVWSSHHMTVFLALFLFYVGLASVTREHQDDLELRPSLLVGFFLAGLVVLGGMQSWWLTPLLTSLSEIPLFFGAAALTAITDNAALTYLGAQVEGLTDGIKYSLVAGAVAGGGLTVIANAPNPAGYGILKSSFGGDGIRPLGLLLAALPATAVAIAALLLLP